jgi:osmotically-inducible protein OsmY
MTADRLHPFFRIGRLFSVLFLAGVMATGCLSGPNRSVGRSLDDASAGNAIKARMIRATFDFRAIDVTVNDGLVLLTGDVTTPEAKMEAERIAWSAPKVRQVANEITVNRDSQSALGVRDSAIAIQIRAKLTTDRRIRSTALNIEVFNGVVFLMGRTFTMQEAQLAAEHASTTAGVVRVVSYITPLDAPQG